ncbi:MAG: flavin reductase family protein [Desulfovibrio sp.]|nr:flavin reductase family protein [Desulfovibrio sp.]
MECSQVLAGTPGFGYCRGMKENSAMKQGNIRRAFSYFESGAVLLVTSSDGKRDNVMTISWQMVLDFSPRIAIATGEWNESFRTILETGECCLCVPSFDMVETVVGVGTMHGSQGDKFGRFELVRSKAMKVRAPLIPDCLAALECRLEDYVEDHGILIFKGLLLWENAGKKDRRVIHANGDGTFFADGEFRDLRREMRDRLPEGLE